MRLPICCGRGYVNQSLGQHLYRFGAVEMKKLESCRVVLNLGIAGSMSALVGCWLVVLCCFIVGCACEPSV